MAKKIKVNIFDDMREAMRDALAYERGEAVDLRVTRIPKRPKPISAKEVRLIRRALNASQSLFAGYLNVSPNAVRSWEQGTRRPRQAAAPARQPADHPLRPQRHRRRPRL